MAETFSERWCRTRTREEAVALDVEIDEADGAAIAAAVSERVGIPVTWRRWQEYGRVGVCGDGKGRRYAVVGSRHGVRRDGSLRLLVDAVIRGRQRGAALRWLCNGQATSGEQLFYHHHDGKWEIQFPQ